MIKVLNNSITLTKILPLPFQLKDNEYFKIHTFNDTSDILIQTINTGHKNGEIL
jgi:hypothetical protein